ncbi:MAG TPA: YdeI/OmpD-associated family protein [Solirubrobacteraceae bacterium]|nr:YdeI/OmpD-associated family protein [Solirubrobacteraceae bacterium]
MRFASAAELEAWLEAEHASSDGVWLEFAKKGSGVSSVTYPEAVELALCFGWIDGQLRKSHDERFYLRRFTPRRARSPWSKVNRDTAEALIAAGRMRPAGLAEVERAKADGRWDAAYAPQSTIEVPEDLQRALDASPAAAERFAGLTRSLRYSILWRVHDAKRPETRARRIADYVGRLERGDPIR